MKVDASNLLEVSTDQPAIVPVAPATPVATVPEVAPIAATCQAMLVFPRAGKRAASLAQGWAWTFANTSLSGILNQWLNEARLTWATTLVPRSQVVAFDAIAGATPGRRIAYDRTLPLPSLKYVPGEESLLLVVNANQFPLCDLRRAIEAHRASRCDVTFISACSIDSKSPYDEKLLVDADGHVRRVDRLYSHAPNPIEHEWPSLVILSGDAARRLNAASLPPSLLQWPAALVRFNFRIGGASVPGHCFDLRDAHQVQDLARAILRDHPHWLVDEGKLQRHAPRVWIGRDVSIDSTAELIGPVAVGDRAHIGAGSVIVGPAIIGQGARIGDGAVLRQAVISPNTTIDSQARIPGRAPRPPLDAGTLDHAIRLQTVIEAAGQPKPLAGLRHHAYCFVKRALDICGASAFLLFTLPFMPLIALAIRLDSRGPIFYGHLRQGRRGRPFKCWKFRTMVNDADEVQQKLRERNEVDGPQFKIRHDPRITRVGAVLRRFNIDEWPQMFNILFGDMSLVGPRPSPERENCMCPAWREARLSVRPGLTGLWQVSRRREEETDFQEWIYYDVQYVKKQSLYLDILILLKTVRVALKGT